MNIPTTFDFNRQDGYREENDFFLQVTTHFEHGFKVMLPDPCPWARTLSRGIQE